MENLRRKYMWSNPQGLKIRNSLTLYTFCSRLSMDSSKPLGHGMTHSLNFYLKMVFTRGVIDKTLFFKMHKNDMILVQVYVDNIIFGSTNDQLCSRFAKLMQSKYEMSMMGELTYFLGLQVSQRNDGIFICQSKYLRDILKKYGLEDASTAKTPMATATKLDQDDPGKGIDITSYRGMIGSLLYLTASRPDIMFATCLCARFQANPKESHLIAVKRISNT